MSYCLQAFPQVQRNTPLGLGLRFMIQLETVPQADAIDATEATTKPPSTPPPEREAVEHALPQMAAAGGSPTVTSHRHMCAHRAALCIEVGVLAQLAWIKTPVY